MQSSNRFGRQAVLGLLAAGALLSAAVPAAAQGVVNVYTNREPGLYSATLDEFTKATGIKVNAMFSEQGLAERIKAEGENSPADVLITVDIGRLQEARRSRHRPADPLGGPRRQHPGPVPRSRRPLVRALAARARRSTPPRIGCRQDAIDLRGPRRPEMEGQALHPLLPAPVQHRPDRGDDRQARRGRDRGMAARRQGEPRQEAVRRRPRRREGHRGRRLRHRPRQPVLCRPDGQRRARAEEMGRGDQCHPADLPGRRHACERLRRGRRQERAEPRQRREARSSSWPRTRPSASSPT